MIVEFEDLVEILKASKRPDQGASPGSALLIRFKVLERAVRSEEHVTPEGRIVVLDFDDDDDVCSIEIAG